MNTIDISVQAQPWSTVFAVAQHFTSDEWLLTGGLMVQAHAMLHGLPVRPTTDAEAALLLSLIDSPDEEAKRLHSSNDRKRILRLHELLAADSDYWSSLDQTHRQDGIDTLDTLTDWAKGEHH